MVPTPPLAHIATRIVNSLNPTLFDYNAPTELSTFVSFFHQWPRFGRSNHLEFTPGYALGAFFVALPFVIVAVLCALFAGIVNCCHGGIRRRGVKREGFDYDDSDDNNDEEAASETSSYDFNGAGCGRILGGVVMFGLAAHLVGLAFVANHFFYSGVSNVIDLSESASISISTEGVGVLRIIHSVLVRIVREIPELAGSLNAVKTANTILRAQGEFTKTTRNVVALTRQFRTYGNIAFWLAVGVYIVLVCGVLLLFSTAFPRRKHQRIAMSIYILPFVMSWCCVAIITASATVAGDLCMELSDFQKIVLVQSKIKPPSLIQGIDVGKNLLVQNNVQCPQQLVGSSIPLASTADNLGAALQSELAVGILGILYPRGSTAQLRDVQRWLLPAIKKVVDCTLITRLAGQYMFTFCGHRGPITALFVAWGSLLAVAIILTISYLLTQFTYFEASRFLTPYIKPDEDIYEAFSGVFGNPSERQSKEAGNSEPPSTKVPKSNDVTLAMGSPIDESGKENSSKRSSRRSSRRSSKRVPSTGFPPVVPKTATVQPDTNVFRMPGEEPPAPINNEIVNTERRSSGTANANAFNDDPPSNNVKGNRRFLARRSPKAPFEAVGATAATGMDITDKAAAAGTAVVAGAAVTGATVAAAPGDGKRKRGKRFSKRREVSGNEVRQTPVDAAPAEDEAGSATKWVAGNVDAGAAAVGGAAVASGRRGKKLFGRNKGQTDEETAAPATSAAAAPETSKRSSRRAEKAAARAAAKANKAAPAPVAAPSNAPAPPPPPPSGLIKTTRGKGKSPPPPPTATRRTGATAMRPVPPSRPISTNAPSAPPPPAGLVKPTTTVGKAAPPPPPPIPGLVKPSTGKSKSPPPPPPPAARSAAPSAPPPPAPVARAAPPPPPMPIRVNKNAPPPPPSIPGLVKPSAGGRAAPPPPPPPPPPAMRR